MIRTEIPVDICPSCNGNGEIALERLFGRFAAAPYRVATCSACSGTGEVPAEAVEHCAAPECDEIFWAGEGCTHMPDTPLCASCKPPRCSDCADERRADR